MEPSDPTRDTFPDSRPPMSDPASPPQGDILDVLRQHEALAPVDLLVALLTDTGQGYGYGVEAIDWDSVQRLRAYVEDRIPD